MATLHVWHASGTAGSPYANWDTAAHTLGAATAAAASGDTIYVASDHTETTAGVALTPNSGSATPTSIICGVRTGSTSADNGISATATSARVASSTTTMTCSAAALYVYGIEFEQTSSSATLMTFFGAASTAGGTLDNCKFICTGTNVGTQVLFGYANTGTGLPYVKLINPKFKFASVSQFVGANGGVVEINGGSIISGSSSPTVFASIGTGSRGGIMYINGYDFNNCGTGFDMFKEGGTTSFARARNIKMPSGWNGDLNNTAFAGSGSRWELLNYGDGDTNYKFQTAEARGICSDSSSVYRTSGSMDEATHYSIKMVAVSSTIGWPSTCLRSLPIIQRVTAAPGVSKSVSVHIVFDNASYLTDREAWIEVEYFGTSGFPLSTTASSGCPPATTATTGSASGESWTGTGGFSAAKAQALTVSGLFFEETGYIVVRVCNAKSAFTFYADAKVEIS